MFILKLREHTSATQNPNVNRKISQRQTSHENWADGCLNKIPLKFGNIFENARRSIFASKRYLDFNKLPINMCNKLFDTLFLPIFLYGSEIWGAYDNMNIKKWVKDPVENDYIHNSTNFFLALINEHLMW